MSTYENAVRSAETNPEGESKYTYKVFAVVIVKSEDIDAFDEMMHSKNNRWAGKIQTCIDDWYVGWVSYMAKGANSHDLTRTDIAKAIANLAQVLFIEDRILVWGDDA